VCEWDFGGWVSAEWRQACIQLSPVQMNNHLTCLAVTRFLLCGVVCVWGGGGERDAVWAALTPSARVAFQVHCSSASYAQITCG
jgi:hypothetical protein